MTAPELGLTSDKLLSSCPASPNCVCSDAEGGSHAIAPLEISATPEAAWQALLEHLEAQPRVTIVQRDGDYLRAESRTLLLRFVDDVEFHLRPSTNQIAMRSASRLGYSDLGTNRRRLEAIRESLAEAGVVKPGN